MRDEAMLEAIEGLRDALVDIEGALVRIAGALEGKGKTAPGGFKIGDRVRVSVDGYFHDKIGVVVEPSRMSEQGSFTLVRLDWNGPHGEGIEFRTYALERIETP